MSSQVKLILLDRVPGVMWCGVVLVPRVYLRSMNHLLNHLLTVQYSTRHAIGSMGPNSAERVPLGLDPHALTTMYRMQCR